MAISGVGGKSGTSAYGLQNADTPQIGSRNWKKSDPKDSNDPGPTDIWGNFTAGISEGIREGSSLFVKAGMMAAAVAVFGFM